MKGPNEINLFLRQKYYPNHGDNGKKVKVFLTLKDKSKTPRQ